jgi:anti-anti-sigma regulatory factor
MEAVIMATAAQSAFPRYQVELAAEFDVQYHRKLRSEVLGALDHGERSVVVDCAAWRRLDLGVLSALIQCAKACGDRGVGFELVNLPGDVRSCIEALSLDHRLGLAPDSIDRL